MDFASEVKNLKIKKDNLMFSPISVDLVASKKLFASIQETFANIENLNVDAKASLG